MNNQEKIKNESMPDDQKSNSERENRNDASDAVNIEPSEIDSGTEENAPGRTAGKAEGSRETIEEDLAQKEKSD